MRDPDDTPKGLRVATGRAAGLLAVLREARTADTPTTRRDLFALGLKQALIIGAVLENILRGERQ